MPKPTAPAEGSGYTSLAALSSDWYWEQDRSYRFTKMERSPSARPMDPFDKSRIIGQRRWDLLDARALSMTWDDHRAKLEAWEPFRDFQFVCSGPHGLLYLSTCGEPVFDAEGRPAGYRGTSRDITTHRLSDQRLCDAQALLQMAPNAGPAGAWSIDLPSLVFTWSNEARVMLEAPLSDPCSIADAIDVYAPEYRAEVALAVAACVAEGVPFSLEAQIITGTQRRIWVSTTGQAEHDASGVVVRVRGALMDMTENRQTSEKSLQLSAKLSLALQTMSDGFYALDREWRFTYLNPEAERALRRPASQLLGRNIWQEFPEAVGSNFHKQYERALAEGVPVAFADFYAPLNLWVQVRACSTPEGLLVFFCNVTENVLAQRKIAQLHADLEERVRARTAELETLTQEMKTFSFSVAHDLRSPLAAISGFAQMLQKEDGADVSPRRRHLLGRIRGAAHQMEEMTEGLLALARVSPAQMHVRPVDLGTIATDLLDKLRERDPQRSVDVQVMKDLWGRGDPVLLTQALSNLLSNAWKFTAKRPHARIEVGSEAGAGGETVYFVRDDGAGFDMGYASRLFGVFSRLHSATEFEGTGIGLAIVKKVIDRHGGRVWAQSAPDRGTAFFFTLSAEERTAPEAARHTPWAPPT